MNHCFTFFLPIRKLFFPVFLSLIFSITITFGQNVNFTTSSLKGISLDNPTSLQFGPDNRLYVSQQNGIIKVYTITRNGANNYTTTATETISLINGIPNHNDDGKVNTSVTTRQITSLLVAGTASSPVLYVTSSDSRIGGPSGDLNLDTNSGILSKLTKTASGWDKTDLIRGFPRSEENHSTNGMQLDTQTNTMYLTVGGFTNAGAPSANFAYITEYALAAAIVSIDLAKIEAMPVKGSGNNKYKYDLPTVDDPTRSNNADNSDVNDPFGGNDGLNQAKVVANGPVAIHSTGYRNAYDFVITKTPCKAGRMYTVDNGPNQGWGGGPDKEGSNGTVTNNYVSGEPGSSGPGINDPQVNNLDGFHYIGNLSTYIAGSYYGGHPNPIRANPAGAGLYTRSGSTGVWRTSKTGSNPLPADWPPVPVNMANPIEGDYQSPGEADKSLLTFPTSTNGLVEYTASNFNSALKGNLLAACYNGNIYTIKLNEAGDGVLNKKGNKRLIQDAPFASNFGSQPLDITAQGDNEIFPGTVWAATYGANAITIFEPSDLVSCSGQYSTTLDEDNDGYSNADEIDNKTNPCQASSKPSDFDGDKISDLNDPDDDNDKIPDNADFFARDSNNGLNTTLPVQYDLFNNYPGTGFFGLGFTGLMNNQKATNNYQNQFDEENLIAGGAVGAFSVVATTAGDALGSLNNQENAFQFGVNVNASTGPFTINGRILANFFNNNVPADNQSQGIYIGTGDQDNYIKIALDANAGKGGIQIVSENAGVATTNVITVANILSATTIDLFLAVNPATGVVQPKYSINGGTAVNAGTAIQTGGALLTAIQSTPALAVGIISTSRNAASYTATWDYIHVAADQVTSPGSWQTLVSSSGTPIGREENAYVQAGDKFYLMGGRGIKAVQIYDPVKKTWTNKSNVPMELHHFQAVTLDGLIYVIGAFTGSYPREKPVSDIYIYNPVTDKWTKGGTIPASRQRGSAGVVVYNKKIYLIGGILDGHWTGHVKWLDEFDPATGTWKTLPDAPHARDHFHAAVANGKIYAAGGRRSSGSTNQVFSLTVPEVDVYDFATAKWTALAQSSNIPTPRAGAGNVVLGSELIVIGGESSQPDAHIETEALNISTNAWRKLANLKQARHGTQAIESNNGIYIATGAGKQGGSPLLTSQEAFYFGGTTTPVGTALTQSSLSGNTSLDFGQVAASSASSKTLVLQNTTGNQAIVITSVTKSGDNSFSYTLPYQLPFVIPAGGSMNVSVNFAPASAGSKSGSISISHTGQASTFTVSLSGNTGGTVSSLYKINSGGPALTLENKTWAADQYFKGGKIFTNTKIGDIAGTNSDALYKTERSSATPFGYAFPVANGTYQVNLHFVEIYWGATGGGPAGAGKRVFGVNLEGGPAELPNFDIYAEAGAMNLLVKTFEVTVNDGMLNIDFSVNIDQPKISAIEILPVTASTADITASPASLHFFSQQAGTVSASQNVTLKNSSAVSKQISTISVMGANSTEFSHDFSEGVTLAAGASKVVAVNFKPASLGTKVAQLHVTYSEAAEPLMIGLTGEGTDNPNQAPVANAGTDNTVTLPVNNVNLSGSGTDTDGTIQEYIWSQVSGPNNAVFSSESVANPSISGLVAGSYVFSLVVKDNLGASSAADQVTLNIQPSPTASQQVTEFRLINADNDQVIQTITEGAVLNLNAFSKNLNIQAVTNPAVVGSVKFALTGPQTKNQTETDAPYALFGDTKGNYYNWVPATGNYTLTATPFTQANGKGTVGTGLTVHFSMVKQALKASGNQRLSDANNHFLTSSNVENEASAEVFPNPAGEMIHVSVSDWKAIRSVTIRNLSGKAVFFSENTVELSQGISVKDFSSGLYLIQIKRTDHTLTTSKIIVTR
ncbi:Kelch repeat-containing protein [Dyadobacter sediminis]|uniref:Choice-of-anchor D domain-containing protein n=1 Tax=Dyadobacter sediminis TaxID=1493691 RepID=A0A5R9KRD4_9BACT|nr:malectin domain-containing carbohydrate-binding protein [Dyadobacter sediminis]TLU98678.1 choice-of-anchor D domain-containing protein [Dyadobacter sediminis]